MQEVSLSSLNLGGVGYVNRVAGNKVIKKHMHNAGFLQGVKIVVLNVSPYTSSFLLDVGGKVMALKKGAVSLINVTI